MMTPPLLAAPGRPAQRGTRPRLGYLRALAILLGATCLVVSPSFLVRASANPGPDLASIDAYIEKEMREVRIPGPGARHRAQRRGGAPSRLRRGRPGWPTRHPADALHPRLGVQVLHRTGDHAAGGVGKGRSRCAGQALPPRFPGGRRGGVSADNRPPPAAPHQRPAGGQRVRAHAQQRHPR